MALGENLSVRSAERILEDWETVAGSSQVEVDLSELSFVELGAGWRLGSAIGAWSRRSEVVVKVPPLDGFSGAWFKDFTRSGLGLALAAYPLSIEADGGDVTSTVREYYRRLGATAASNNNVVLCDLHHRADLRNPNVFAQEFSDWAPFVGLEHIDSARRAARIPFLSMVREAVSNVYDHAYRRPCPPLQGKLNYLSLRRYATVTSASGTGSLDRYLEKVEPPTDAEQLGWIEIVVIDDGCGIAVRHSQDPQIHAADTSSEDKVLASALTSGESVKTKTRDAPANGDPGYGFTYIAAGLRHYQAYAELRTGRRLLTLDASSPDCDGFVINEQTLGRIHGTALHIVFPLFSSQLRIDV